MKMVNALVSNGTMDRLRNLAARYREAYPGTGLFADVSDVEILRSFLVAGEIRIKMALDDVK